MSGESAHEESYFGRGLLVCLIKFAEHLGEEKYLRLFPSGVNGYVYLMNGASDHLLEIEVPKRWKNTELEQKILELRDLSLEMGHGFTGKKWAKEDFLKLKQLTEEICLTIDRKLGLKDADLGEW
jgi:hypothetical protein